MDNRKFYPIKEASRDQWEGAMSLAWRTFKKFDAPDYSERGVESFLEFISDEGLYRMFLIGEYHVFVAMDEEEIVGVIALRAISHISLLFVDEHHHNMGIGRSLINYAAMYVREEKKRSSLTVNAAPFAVDFYSRLGFKRTAPETENDGILYFPMIFEME